MTLRKIIEATRISDQAKIHILRPRENEFEVLRVAGTVRIPVYFDTFKDLEDLKEKVQKKLGEMEFKFPCRSPKIHPRVNSVGK